MEPTTSGEFPRTLLLATDLSCRCDRALDRAVGLARAWGARLIAATVIEPDPGEFMERDRPTRMTKAERARRTLESYLGDTDLPVEIMVATGEPAAELLSISESRGCDFLVTGIARNDTLGSLLLGGTAKRLISNATVPALIVQERAAGIYRNIVVAAGRTDVAQAAILASARLFPEARITLLHARDAPVAAGIAPDSGNSEDQALADTMRADISADPRIGAELGARLEVVVAAGSIESLIGEFTEDHAADLTIVASRGRGAIFEALVGSTEHKLLDSHSGDLLIVRSGRN
ncbi:universal stress protein [Sphingomonas colocasiae]|uniref:Universal stress protein n=1 Tax=Sphingomonas colocasiae TaxID=1848973 RepID=A0ABS7PQ61_9SPHN|nr:universal stress protein [Sphingomonas colocasiae]MBY8823462.1 universal stress protein [Sphingomonas colocasiae]